LREYDKLAQQCAAEGVDHPRYLLRLAELELIDRERRMVRRHGSRRRRAWIVSTSPRSLRSTRNWCWNLPAANTSLAART
jgi:hypothetical protein